MSSRRSPWQIDTARLLRTLTLCLGLFVYFFFAGDNRSVCLAADPLERLISTNQAISWSGQPLAAGLVQLSQEFGVTIWLDRRVDPTTKIEMQANASRLEVLQLIAQRADATVVIAAPLVIIARPEHADRLASSVFATRQIVQATPALRGLLNNKRFAWELLSTPQEILQAAEKAWGVRVPAESLPHDQWRAATFTSIDGATILALVGGGFNRTIAVRNNALTWSELPDRVAITKAYAAPQDPSAVREEVLRVDSQAVWKIDRNKIQLQATAAAHQVVWIATLAPAKAIAKTIQQVAQPNLVCIKTRRSVTVRLVM